MADARLELLVRRGRDVLMRRGDRLIFGRQFSPWAPVIAVVVVVGLPLSCGLAANAPAERSLVSALIGLLGLALFVGLGWADYNHETIGRFDPKIVVDLHMKVLLSRKGHPIASLGDITIVAVGSDGEDALEIRWPGGALSVLEGPADDGHLAGAIERLRSCGLDVTTPAPATDPFRYCSAPTTRNPA